MHPSEFEQAAEQWRGKASARGPQYLSRHLAVQRPVQQRQVRAQPVMIDPQRAGQCRATAWPRWAGHSATISRERPAPTPQPDRIAAVMLVVLLPGGGCVR